jgi:hypothetical protein
MVTTICALCKGKGTVICPACARGDAPPDPACTECKGAGRVVCTGCMGGGIIDTTAFA